MLYKYHVDWMDNGSRRQDDGIVAAAGYGDAAVEVSQFYGERDIVTLELTEIEPLLEFNDLSEMIAEESHDLHG